MIDVLLTDKDILDLWASIPDFIQLACSRTDFEHIVAKAQCLKLLDVLKQPCTHGKWKLTGDEMNDGREAMQSECYQCMEKIEAMLKEG
jgi:hypothetical protein